MTVLPPWLAIFAGIDDAALIALGNAGLLRRAGIQVAAGRVTSLPHDDSAGERDTDSATLVVRVGEVDVVLTVGGPAAARCPCPVAGTCVHLMAAFLWTREAAARAVATSGTAPAVEDSTAAQAPAPPADPDVVAEILGWEPAQVHRAVGLAAVRRAHRAEAEAPVDPSTVETRSVGSRLSVARPGGPEVFVVAGGGVGGMIVEGDHSDVALNAEKLRAVVAVFAAHGRRWTWPEGLAADGVHSGQRDAASHVRRTCEETLAGGLARASGAEADRLAAAAARARLEALPLLSSLTAAAAGLLADLTRRVDDVDESTALSALAQAWALASALDAPGPLTAALTSGTAPETARLGLLVPLSARWWLSPTGARGVTVRLWDCDHCRIETVTTGRAAGADPAFDRSWDTPLLWGASMATLCAGPFRLTGAERRSDGRLSPTSRCRIAPEPQVEGSAFDLLELARAVNAVGRPRDAVRFGVTPEPVRIVLPRRTSGLDELRIDEVAQQIVWRVVDAEGVPHDLRLPATSAELSSLHWLTVKGELIRAVVATGDRPDAVFVADESGAPRLVSLTLTPVRTWAWGKAGKRLRERLERLQAVPGSAPRPSLAGLPQLFADVGEIVAALASTGRPACTRWQSDALGRRIRLADELGLRTLSAGLREVLGGPTAAGLLRVRFLLDRLTGLADTTF